MSWSSSESITVNLIVCDAALAPDPVRGTGIGRALESAAWLVDKTAPALRDGDSQSLDRTLVEYSRKHGRRLSDPSPPAIPRPQLHQQRPHGRQQHTPHLGPARRLP
jgi:hypothetical protein